MEYENIKIIAEADWSLQWPVDYGKGEAFQYRSSWSKVRCMTSPLSYRSGRLDAEKLTIMIRPPARNKATRTQEG